VLTEKDRVRLAPFLARILTTRAEVAAACQETTAAGRRLEKSKDGTGWRDRSFGGCFSREPARARAYRNARRAYAGAAAAFSRCEKRLARCHRKADARIRAMMRRLDPNYDRFAAAIKQCDRAEGECQRMRRRIAAAIASARTASVKRGGSDDVARAAVAARRQYPQLVVEVRNGAPDVGQALDSARRAVRAAGGEAQHLAWNAAWFDQLPQAAADFAARRRPVKAHDPLQRLHHHVNQAIDTMKRWRTETTTAAATAVAAARDRLVDEFAMTGQPVDKDADPSDRNT
jgi:hypothetical protein